MIKLSQNILKLDRAFDLLELHTHHPERYPYLLESVLHGTPQARYDILFAFPGNTFESGHGGQTFLSQFDQHWNKTKKSVEDKHALPFQGGWFLYLGYELAAEIEPRLGQFSSAPGLPTAFATYIPSAVIRDHEQQCCYLVSEPGSESLLSQMADDIATLPQESAALEIPSPILHGMVEDDPQTFLAGVERIRNYIREGDVFQVNLSRAWRLEVSATATQLYRRLRQHNPAPFAALVNYQGRNIISSSPERLVNVEGTHVSTRPIAGTRPRGLDQTTDQAFLETLLAHPKERAEHVMLIDLERNDLGRVCKSGTVKVDELMVLESYAHVHHIVSNICGELRSGVTPGEIINAVFPGGTITGCPKVRCMEIIHELEQTHRGPYTGSIGYVSHCGRMDLNILIRTMLLEGQCLSFRTGAGIVADSVPDNELKETRAKARGLLKALGVDDHVPAQW